MSKPAIIFASVIGLILVAGIAVFSLLSRNTVQTTQPASGQPDATQELTTTSSNSAASSTDTTSTTPANTSGYADGTYTASATYRTPESTEPITVTLTLKSGIVTDVSVATNPQAPETRRYQSQFVANYKQYVLGKNIDDIQLSRVSGSSLTSGGFNAALEKIKAQAQA